ncbi:hypothetical protein [Rubinisphaera sp.]|uniref:hypothetical protein n=1 Tax=Rubinisphaera sp. TaxID=2024857 RepID=UPI000C11D24D|nr:hypothetical protein [Rubinisphaera sp.]MBV08088.1 hypothetical protein [Rubinisphaera sp.]|tara:strand:+ start:6846 stop:7322 length:477 start_codon:yes stop_codon:yes gene_type:complete
MLELTAYHEAGHAMMAVYLGAFVESITINPDWDDGPERYGDVTIVWSNTQLTKQDLEDRVRVALAGPVVEMIYRQEPFHPALVAEWAQDWQDAWHWAEPLEKQPKRRLAYLENMAVELYRFFDEENAWAATAAIVDHLLAHETLEGEEISDIMSEWLR